MDKYSRDAETAALMEMMKTPFEELDEEGLRNTIRLLIEFTKKMALEKIEGMNLIQDQYIECYETYGTEAFPAYFVTLGQMIGARFAPIEKEVKGNG